MLYQPRANSQVGKLSRGAQESLFQDMEQELLSLGDHTHVRSNMAGMADGLPKEQREVDKEELEDERLVFEWKTDVIEELAVLCCQSTAAQAKCLTVRIARHHRAAELRRRASTCCPS